MIMLKKNIGFRIQGEFQSRCTGFQIVGDPSHTIQQEILTQEKFDEIDEFLVLLIFNLSNVC